MIIRQFSAADCGAVLGLADDLGLCHWSLSDYREELKRNDSVMLVAEYKSDLVGFIVGRRIPGSGSDADPEAEIYNIGVNSAFHRTGAGTRLMREFLHRCRRSGVSYIWLDVRASNEGAINFYEHFGFIRFTVRPKFYRNPPDDGIIMRLALE